MALYRATALLLALGVVALALAGNWQRAASVSLLTPADVTGPLSDEEGPPLNLNGNVMQVKAPRATARMMALIAEHSSQGAKHGHRTQQLGPGAVPMRGVTDMGDCPPGHSCKIVTLPKNDPAPAVQRRARTQQLFNAAANDDVLRWNTADGHLHLMLPHKPAAYSAKKTTSRIAHAVQAADDQDSVHEGIYKSALTQKLFIVPQANVLTGTGQKHLTSAGSEDVAAEKTAEAKGAKSIMSAAKKSALEKKKDTARQARGTKKAQVVPGGVRPMGAKQVASSGNEEYGQSGFTLAEVRKREERVGGGGRRGG